jgi:hypothetical protein
VPAALSSPIAAVLAKLGPLDPLAITDLRPYLETVPYPGHVTDPYAAELAQHDSSPSFLIQATYDRDGNELIAEVTSA